MILDLQALLFHLGEHPNVKNYYQCVMFDALSQFQSIFYNMTTMCAMYACPLITFIYCYGAIYLKIYRESKRMTKGVGESILNHLQTILLTDIENERMKVI